MRAVKRLEFAQSRRAILGGASFTLIQMALGMKARAAETPASRFEFLSKNGNSSCTKAFLDSIPSMPSAARLLGSCCSPMELDRYVKHTEGLTKYRAIADILSDPYDIDAALAQKLLTYYDLALTPEQQKAYDYAMANSAEKGPCCCRCWRWKVFGGARQAADSRTWFRWQASD